MRKNRQNAENSQISPSWEIVTTAGRLPNNPFCTMKSDEINQLINAAQHGSQEAFRSLVLQFQDIVRGTIRRMVPESEVDDLAQDVFISFAQRLRDSQQNNLNSPSSWLKSVARNRAITFWRRNAARKAITTPTLGWVPDTREGNQSNLGQTSDELQAQDIRARQLAGLHHCIGLLSSAHREILDGFYSLGQSTELLATQTGKGTGALRMMLVRIRRALAKCIRKQLELPDDELE